MAASDKNNKGKRTDCAKHFSFVNGGSPMCGTKGFGYSTNNLDDIDCVKCTNWIMQQSIIANDKQK